LRWHPQPAKTCALELARRVPAAAQEALKFIAFGLAEFDPIT
jgi:hypothetical protein